MGKSIKDSIKITGRLHLKVYENGVLVKEYNGKNLVVKGGKSLILNMMATGSPSFFVQKVGFGTNATAPADGDNALTAAFIKPIASAVVASPDITFTFTLNSGEANGLAIAEFGLLSDTNILFARKTGITVNKTASVTINGTWIVSLN